MYYVVYYRHFYFLSQNFTLFYILFINFSFKIYIHIIIKYKLIMINKYIERIHNDLNDFTQFFFQDDFKNIISQLLNDNKILKERIAILENQNTQLQQVQLPYTIDRIKLAELTGFSKSNIIKLEEKGIINKVLNPESKITIYNTEVAIMNIYRMSQIRSVNQLKIEETLLKYKFMN